MKRKKVQPIGLTISLIIIIGFIISGTSTLLSFQSLFENDVEAVSELTSENIYSNVNSLMERPINVSITMAHDTFLRDFMEKETDDGLFGDDLIAMQQYLSSYKEKYQFDSVFLVSAKTKSYYHYENGIDRVLTQDNPENEWYYNFLDDPSDCSLNVDNDEAKDNLVTVFVNCKLYDEKGTVLGVIGVGIVTPYLQTFLVEKEQEYGVQAYLIDADGNIQISADLTEFESINLFDDPNFSTMASAIDTTTSDSNQRWYHSRERDGYVITKYIPNLNWYLVVEKSTQEFQAKITQQLLINFAFLLCIVSVSILITTRVIKKYDIALINLAEMDQLTGIRNRTSYERELRKYTRTLDTFQHFGIGVCDLNNLKSINDLYGHQFGDECIKEFSATLCAVFKHCPVFRIGGDEFVIIFLNMTEDEAHQYWKELSTTLKERNQTNAVSISAAFGCSFYQAKQLDTINKIFKDADDKMYLNKKEAKGTER